MGIFIDLTGKTFGDLKIIGRTAIKGKRIRWIAECSCGKNLQVYGDQLKSNNERRAKTKCNSCTRKRPSNDLSGRNFGNWKVLCVDGIKNSKQMWKVQCSCGKIYSVSKYSLLNGTSRKCKNCPEIDLSGKKFGKWTVIKRDPNNSLRWLALCDCGKEFNILRTTLVNGSSTQCRHCYSNRDEKIPFSQWASLIRGAETRNLNWDSCITREWLWALFIKQNKKCALTGMDICFSSKPKETTASLDRIDSCRGYEADNVHYVHKHVNIMKRDFPEPYFIEICKMIANKN